FEVERDLVEDGVLPEPLGHVVQGYVQTAIFGPAAYLSVPANLRGKPLGHPGSGSLIADYAVASTATTPKLNTLARLSQYAAFQRPFEAYLPMIRLFDARSPMRIPGPMSTKTKATMRFRTSASWSDRKIGTATAGIDSSAYIQKKLVFFRPSVSTTAQELASETTTSARNAANTRPRANR